jgi:AcrR family transcriptional regulator
MPLEGSTHSERIVAAATKLFALQGYHGTSTRGIARLAGVSENTIFRQFNHKENVFWSALRSEAESLKPQWEHLSGIREGDAPEIVLPEILALLTETINAKPEMLRLLAIALLELRADAETVCSDLISPVFSELCAYLAASIKKGNVLEVDPTLLTAAFMSMVLIFPQISKLKGNKSPSYESDQEAVRACSRFWLALLSPRPQVRASDVLATERQSST